MHGRTRHILVATLGVLRAVVVHAADSQDRAGAKLLVPYRDGGLPRLKLIGADGGDAGKLVDWVQATFGWVLAIVQRPQDAVGVEVLPKRWIVERTFGWWCRYRRLSKDDEERVEVSETFVYVAMIHLMLRRLAR